MKYCSIVLVTLVGLCLAEPPVNRYLPSRSSSQHSAPSQQYGAPSQQFSAPSQQYGAPSQQYGAPSQQYSAPSQQYGAPSGPSQFSAPSAPSQQYGAPNGHNGQTQALFSSRPSQKYSAPRPSQNYGAPSNQYLPGNEGQGYGRGGHGGEEYNEPANYNFEYMVKDDHYGTDFGHKESRQGDRAEGQYYVLLPDGRKQIVTYEADENGYRPKISYEDTGLGGGYGRGPANGGYSGGNDGYSSGAQGPY